MLRGGPQVSAQDNSSKQQQQQQKQKKRLSFRDPEVEGPLRNSYLCAGVKSKTLIKPTKATNPKKTSISVEDLTLDDKALQIVQNVGNAFSDLSIADKVRIDFPGLESIPTDFETQKETEIRDSSPSDFESYQRSCQFRNFKISAEDQEFLDDLVPPLVDVTMRGPSFENSAPNSPKNCIPAESPQQEGRPSSNTQHQVQLLRYQLEQQNQQTQMALHQVQLLQDQMDAESIARRKALEQNNQLMQQNQELLNHMEKLFHQIEDLEKQIQILEQEKRGKKVITAPENQVTSLRKPTTWASRRLSGELVSEKPTTWAASRRPSNEQMNEKPTSWTTNRRPSEQTNEKPTTWTASRRPSSEQVNEKPTTWTASRRPSSELVNEKPTSWTMSRRPSSEQVSEKPTTWTANQRPSSEQVNEKPMLLTRSQYTAAKKGSVTSTKPLGATPKIPTTQNSTAALSTRKAPNISSKPLAIQTKSKDSGTKEKDMLRIGDTSPPVQSGTASSFSSPWKLKASDSGTQCKTDNSLGNVVRSRTGSFSSYVKRSQEGDTTKSTLFSSSNSILSTTSITGKKYSSSTSDLYSTPSTIQGKSSLMIEEPSTNVKSAISNLNLSTSKLPRYQPYTGWQRRTSLTGEGEQVSAISKDLYKNPPKTYLFDK